MHIMVMEHLGHLARVASTDATLLDQLEPVTTALMRALIVTAGRDQMRLNQVLEQTLNHRIRQFILKNLADPDLNPDQIAKAHHISVRHLYKIWSHSDVTLSQWIIHRRLERAHEQLTRPSTRTVPIAVISARVGFSDPTHFTRRFRDIYGLTPRECRNESQSQQ